jgi:diphosphoinositol-polyphosphate diphosphatase
MTSNTGGGAAAAKTTQRDKQRYGDDGARLVVGCIPIIVKGSGEVEVIAISSSKRPDESIFPKGGWEVGETREQGALREAFEEAGVTGWISRSLGEYCVSKPAGRLVLHMYEMVVEGESEVFLESKWRVRRHMALD